jgi:hypothetical protein
VDSPGRTSIARVVLKMRSAAGGLSRLDNLLELAEAIANVEDNPGGETVKIGGEQARQMLSAAIRSLPTEELRRVAQMMLCQGTPEWADPALGIGRRRELYIRDPASLTLNRDTLRTRREPEVALGLASSMCDRPSSSSQSRSLEALGIIDGGCDFYRDVPWSALLDNTDTLSLFFTYGRTWRRSLGGSLEAAAGRLREFRVVLPAISAHADPFKTLIAGRFGQSESEISERVSEAAVAYSLMGAEVRFHSMIQTHASYIFKDSAVVSLYSHRPGSSGAVPTIQCSSAGSMYSFLMHDFDFVWSKSMRNM